MIKQICYIIIIIIIYIYIYYYFSSFLLSIILCNLYIPYSSHTRSSAGDHPHLMSCHPSPTLPMSGLKLMREIPSDLKVGVAGGLSTVVNGAIL